MSSPEAQGVVCGMVFLVILFLFIPIPFVGHLDKLPTFPYDQVFFLDLINYFLRCIKLINYI